MALSSLSRSACSWEITALKSFMAGHFTQNGTLVGGMLFHRQPNTVFMQLVQMETLGVYKEVFGVIMWGSELPSRTSLRRLFRRCVLMQARHIHPFRHFWKLRDCRKSRDWVGFGIQGGISMLERLLLPEKHAISILMKDHDIVKELFDRFEKSESVAEKEKIIADALTELKIHATIEEEIFYPAVRKRVGKDLMNEADEEHHVARVLIAELDRDGRGNDHRDAKFTVLAESVRHHIKEEEGEMLPKAKSVDMASKRWASKCWSAKTS
jgi:hypothetical protein